MEALIILAGIALLGNKIISTLKFAVAGDWVAARTQVLVWVVTVAVICLCSQADLTATLVIPGTSGPLGDQDFFSLLLIGLMCGASGSFAYDIKSAIDGQDSAREPRMTTNPADQ